MAGITYNTAVAFEDGGQHHAGKVAAFTNAKDCVFIEVMRWRKSGNISIGEPIYFKKKLEDVVVIPTSEEQNGK
jgi:hypothetical protein